MNTKINNSMNAKLVSVTVVKHIVHIVDHLNQKTPIIMELTVDEINEIFKVTKVYRSKWWIMGNLMNDYTGRPKTVINRLRHLAVKCEVMIVVDKKDHSNFLYFK